MLHGHRRKYKTSRICDRKVYLKKTNVGVEPYLHSMVQHLMLQAI